MLFSGNLRAAAQNMADAFFRLTAREHHLMSAAAAAQAKVHTRAQHLPLAAAAGVRFFHDQNIIEPYVHCCCQLPVRASFLCYFAALPLISSQ